MSQLIEHSTKVAPCMAARAGVQPVHPQPRTQRLQAPPVRYCNPPHEVVLSHLGVLAGALAFPSQGWCVGGLPSYR